MALNISTSSNRDAEMTAGAAWTTSPRDSDANATFAAQPTADDQNDISADPSAAAPETSAGPGTHAGSNEPADGGSSSAGNGDDALDSVTGSGIGNIAGLGQQGDGSGLELVGPNGALQSQAYDSDVAVAQLTGSEGLVQTIARAATGSSGPLQDAAGVIYAVGPGAIGATPSADGHSNLASDLLNLPGNILAGNLNDGLSHIGPDLTGIADATGVLVNGVLHGNDPLLPTSGILGDLGGGLQNVPILTANGGNNGNDGGLLGGTVGDFNGSSTGHLIDLDAGPQNDDGLALNVLATPDSDPGHTAAINAIDVGPSGPQLLDAGVATGHSPLDTPALDGLGLQDLSGGQTGDLLTVNGGNNASDGGLAGAAIGDLNGSSNGHHLVDGDVGPNGNGNTIDVLAAPTGSSNTLNANAIDVGPNAPQLADLGVLTDPGLIHVPALNGTGTDGLSGLTADLLNGPIDTAHAGPVPAVPTLLDLGSLPDIQPGSITGDHGIVDVNGHHIV